MSPVHRAEETRVEPLEERAKASAWLPFRHPMFRALWIATVISNIGTWMQSVAAGWLMTSLSPSPMMVALVQAATMLPMFLFALPAGVLADIMDRRKLLLLANAWSLLNALLLGILTWLGLVTPLILLAATFGLGVGAALSAPPFQAIVPELVPKNALPPAVALNSMGVNLSRAIGPVVGGLIISTLGAAPVFLLNGLSCLSVLFVLWRWKRPPKSSKLPPEYFFPALRAGWRYARQSPGLQTVLLRAVAFFFFASAIWALLPVVAVKELAHGASGYGILLTCIGLGAVGGAFTLPRLRQRFSPDAVTVTGTLVFAAATLVTGMVHNFYVVCSAMLLVGFAWIAVLSAFNVAAQLAIAEWVRARGLALYQVVFFGCMALGSVFWGQVAVLSSTSNALVLATFGMLLGSISAFRHKLASGANIDLAPSMHWPEPPVELGVSPDRGPVLVTVEYQIDAVSAADFVAAMADLERARRRSGAFAWGLYEDVAAPGRYLEHFIVDSWLDHLRQHERITMADRAIQEIIQRFHTGTQPPKVSHFVAARSA